MNKKIFWIFSSVQALSLAAIIYLLFYGLNEVADRAVVGMDTQILLSITFPLFMVLTQYMCASRE